MSLLIFFKPTLFLFNNDSCASVHMVVSRLNGQIISLLICALTHYRTSALLAFISSFRLERGGEGELLPREDHTFEILVEKDMNKV